MAVRLRAQRMASRQAAGSLGSRWATISTSSARCSPALADGSITLRSDSSMATVPRAVRVVSVRWRETIGEEGDVIGRVAVDGPHAQRQQRARDALLVAERDRRVGGHPGVGERLVPGEPQAHGARDEQVAAQRRIGVRAGQQLEAAFGELDGTDVEGVGGRSRGAAVPRRRLR